MSQLVEFLYPLPDLKRTPLSILKWWESRRIQYNIIVGGTGLLSLGIVRVIMWLPPGPAIIPPIYAWQVIVFYGIMANGMYSLGWLTEIAVEKLLGRTSAKAGPALLRMGLTFSVGLTLLPVALAGFEWVFRVLKAIL